MEIYIILKKNYPTTVLKKRVGDLNGLYFTEKFKDYFNTHNMTFDSEVFVKCDKYGNYQYRGKKQTYRIYDINRWDVISVEDIKKREKELVETLNDMVTIADSENWGLSVTGRQIILKKAKELIEKYK